MGISRGASKLIASTLGESGPRRRAITFGGERAASGAAGRKTFSRRMRASLRKRFFGWGARAL